MLAGQTDPPTSKHCNPYQNISHTLLLLGPSLPPRSTFGACEVAVLMNNESRRWAVLVIPGALGQSDAAIGSAAGGHRVVKLCEVQASGAPYDSHQNPLLV